MSPCGRFRRPRLPQHEVGLAFQSSWMAGERSERIDLRSVDCECRRSWRSLCRSKCDPGERQPGLHILEERPSLPTDFNFKSHELPAFARFNTHARQICKLQDEVADSTSIHAAQCRLPPFQSGVIWENFQNSSLHSLHSQTPIYASQAASSLQAW